MKIGQNQFRSISRLLDQGDYETAVEAISVFKKEYPSDCMKAALLEARLFDETGDRRTAIQTLQRALAKSPDDIACQYKLACYFEYDQRWPEAKAAISNVVRLSIAKNDNFFLMDSQVRSAWYSIKTGDYDTAKAELLTLPLTDSFISDYGPVTVRDLLAQIQS